MRDKKALFLVLSIFVLVAAGCGGGGDGTGLPPAPAGGGGGSTGTGPAYDPSTATATVTGSIMFEGTPPEMPLVQMAADPYCQQNFSGARSKEVVVTDDGKLEYVIVYVRSGHEGASYSVPTDPVLIDQMGCSYHPHAFTMMSGQTLTIRNSDATLHNIHAWAEVNTPFNIGQPVQNMETMQVFAQPEMPLPMRCDVHRWMEAFIGVFDHPFHTNSGETGDYTLRLPPGTYELVAWHERYGEQVSTVTVGDGETVDLNFAFAADAAD
jgi:plastocyanin